MPAKKITRSKSATTSTRRRSSTQSVQRGGRKPPKKKKQDNTKLFIGIGVGVFFFIFIIIAAASGGGDSRSNSSSSSLSADFLTVSQRKEIYREYNREYDILEQDASGKMANLSMEERRTYGRTIQKKKSNLQAYLPQKMVNKFSSKYKGITLKYVQKHVIQAGDNNQW